MGAMKLATAGLLIVAFGVLHEGSPVHAACSSWGNGGDDYTNAAEDGCYKVQARLDKYFGGTVNFHYGPQAEDFSQVINNNGIGVGNYKRHNASNQGWGSWTSVPSS